MTCKDCIYSKYCIMYEPKMRACKDYEKTTNRKSVDKFARV